MPVHLRQPGATPAAAARSAAPGHNRFVFRLGEERRNVHVEGSRADEYLRIARPSQTLIALRAIGWDIKKIALLPPDDIALQLVDQRVGTIELAVGGVAEWMTIPETASMSGTPGYPESSTYRKP